MKKILMLSVIFAVSQNAMAETKKCDIKGDKNVCGNTAKNLTVNYGITDETVKMILIGFVLIIVGYIVWKQWINCESKKQTNLVKLNKEIEHCEKSIKQNDAIGNNKGNALIYANLGNFCEQKGDKAAAKDYYQESIDLYKNIGSPMAAKVQSRLDALQ